jgi:hypothetical protein
MLYISYVTLIMILWELYNLVAILVEFDMDSLLLFSPYFRRSLGLRLTCHCGSCRVELVLEVWSYFPYLLPKVMSDFNMYVI